MIKTHLPIRDSSFGHCLYSNNPQPPTSFAKHIEWDRDVINNNTIYTDYCIHEAPVSSTIWLLEPYGIIPHIYDNVLNSKNKYKTIWCHDKHFLNKMPNSKFVPVGGCWIEEKDRLLHPKTKQFSIIASNKNQLEGHQMRHTIIQASDGKVDSFGPSYTQFKVHSMHKIEALADYRYHFAIENCKRDYYFTEKLIDCFATGTIPIYWGCPSIGDFFNTDGMIIFNDLFDLKEKLKQCTPEFYESKKNAIVDNFNRVQYYQLAEDWIYNNNVLDRT